MALVRDMSESQIAFVVGEGTPDQFSVRRYAGSEGLCQLYRFEIELASTEETVEFDTIVGKPATLTVNTDYGERWFHGVIARFEMTGETTDLTYYRAELVPAVWLLTHRYNSRIFQKKTTKEIIAAVLEKGGIASDRIDMSQLQRTYEPRGYCCQYRETDYNFICRLMEEEGIRWFFEQSQEGHTLFLADSGDSYAPIEGESAALPYHPPTGMNVQQEHVFRFRKGQCVRPGAVVLRDYNFEKPALNLEAKSDAGRDAGFEFADYPGEYVEQGPGSELATIRAEEFESTRIVGTGLSNSPRLAVGRTFEVSEHTSEPLNGSYFLTAIKHQGKQATARSAALSDGVKSSLDQGAARARSQWLYHNGQVSSDMQSIAGAQGSSPLEPLTIPNLLDDESLTRHVDAESPVYECRFECMPADVSYRPARVTPWPSVRGTQTARVTGPSGEEIYTDEYGRVKVKFNWDREGKHDENSSCWIRVSQGMAGGQYGMMFLPRVGQEVVVDFLEGDIDKPIITGRVYNADQMPPYKLPDEKTKSVIKTHTSKGGGGTNEIRFEDLKDKEQILIYAQKNLHVRVNADRVENIGNDHHLSVKKNKFELVEEASNRDVKLDLNEKIGGNKSLDVGGDLGQKVGGNYSNEVGADAYIKAGGKIVLEGTKEITLKVGGNFVKIDASGVTVMGTMIKLNSGGSAGTGSAVALTKPEETVDADSAEPGKDVTYSDSGDPAAATAEAGPPGAEYEQTEIEQELSWVEIALVNEAGEPVPHENWKATLADGSVKQGVLNAEGRAHIGLPAAEEVQISFPQLDAEAWVRDTGAVPPAPAGAGGSSPPPSGTSSGTNDGDDEGGTVIGSGFDEDEEEEIMLSEEDEGEEDVQTDEEEEESPDDDGGEDDGGESNDGGEQRKNPYRK